MKTNLRVRFLGVFFVLLLGAWSADARFSSIKAADSTSFNQFKGSILDSKTRNELIYASITVAGTSISTISNSEGKFAIKVPKDNQNASLIISFLGYKNKVVSINELKAEKNILYLEPSNTVLEEVVVNSSDVKTLFLGVLNNRLQNYGDDPLAMTGFYRESIKKRRTYVSLSESIVKTQKEPFTDGSQDLIDLFKGRKNTDYTKLDTCLLYTSDAADE